MQPDDSAGPGSDAALPPRARSMAWMLAGGALASLVLAGFAAVSEPFFSGSIAGRVAFCVLALPLYFVGQGVADWAWSTRMGRAALDHPSAVGRILLGVLVLGVPSALFLVAYYMFRGWLGHSAF
jgi:hypothetical protein